MASPITYAQTNLGYPIFDAEFDPYNRGYLIVGGGGGEGRSGVSNKISLLDVSSRSEISTVAEIDLGQNEDSVQSLASLATADGLITYAGINSSVAERDEGRNEHFRSFEINYPAKKKRRKDNDDKVDDDGKEDAASISRAAKTPLFQSATTKTRHITQKFLCLSPPRMTESGNRRLGAIATGLDKGDKPEGEVVLFAAASSQPDKNSVLARIRPKEGIHVEDIALDEPSEGLFALAYCSEHSVLLHQLKHDLKDKEVKASLKEYIALYSVPPADAYNEPGRRPRIRSIRWLSPSHLLILQNYPPRSGAELLVLWINEETGKPGDIILRKALPKSCKLAVGLDVCRLDADPATGERQIVVAVSSQDYSIHVLTIDHKPQETSKAVQMAKFNNFTHLRDVHSYPITKITFSNFFPPKQPENTPTSIASKPQYISLASVSLANTVVVDTFALTSTPTSPQKTPEASRRRNTPAVRWVLSSGGIERLRTWGGLIVVAFAVLIFAVSLQSYLSAQGLSRAPSILSTFRSFEPPGAIPPHMRNKPPPAPPVSVSTTPPAAPPGSISLPPAAEVSSAIHHHHLRDVRSLLHAALHRHHDPAQPALVVHPHPTDDAALAASRATDVAALEAQGARRFEDLAEHERERWKKWLSDAGHWSADEGETVLKGVFFSQWAEIVGGAIREAVLQ